MSTPAKAPGLWDQHSQPAFPTVDPPTTNHTRLLPCAGEGRGGRLAGSAWCSLASQLSPGWKA